MASVVIIIVFHVLMLLVGLGIVTHVVPERVVSSLLGYLHNAIGITTASREIVTMIALIWIGATVVIVDGCIFLLVSLTRLSNSG
jgi:hypothetical protein